MASASDLPSLLDAAEAAGGSSLDLSLLSPPLRGALPAAVVARLGARLERLNAAGHSLSALPPGFCGAALPRLRTAFFLGNAFSAVPAALGGLPSLFMLSFKSQRPPAGANADAGADADADAGARAGAGAHAGGGEAGPGGLVEVPGESLAPSLGWLILTDNRIARLPSALGRLSALRKLMLAGNALEALPDEIAGCVSLELVRLSDNRLTAVPPALLRLPRLAWLALAGNPCCPALPPFGAGPGGGGGGGGGGASAFPRRLRAARLTLGRKLGEGASGAVHAAEMSAEDEGGGAGAADTRAVAVKLFKASSSDGRPEDELAAALALGPHEALVSALGWFRAEGAAADGALGLVMELAPGSLLGAPPSFASVTRDTFAPTAACGAVKALRVARAVAAALAHMHSQGLVHGDVYLHNVLATVEGEGACGTGPAPAAKATAAAVAEEAERTQVRLCDLGAAFFAPGPPNGALRRGLERLEARAFGCLLEDLLALGAAEEAADGAEAAAEQAAAAAEAAGGARDDDGARARVELLAGLFSEREMARGLVGHEVAAELAPGLFVANRRALEPPCAWLRSASVRADVVVTCAAELEREHAGLAVAAPFLRRAHFVGMVEADARLADATGADAARFGVTAEYSAALAVQLAEAADLAQGHLAEGRRVVVACKFGANRSASAALALLARHRGVPLAAGLELLRAARCKVYPNIETWPSLLAIERAALGRNSLSERELLSFHTWAPAPRRRAKAAAARATLRALARDCVVPDVAARPSLRECVTRLTS